MSVLDIIKIPFTAFLNWRDFTIFKKRIRSISKESNLVIFDIDNTITCTWPSLLVEYTNERQRILSLAVNINCFAYLKEMLCRENCNVFFLSHRSFKIKPYTIDWFSSILGIDVKENVFFTSSPEMKLNYLDFASSKINVVEFIDDLSFNHEKGSRLVYDDVISKIKGMKKVDYRGIDFLEGLDDKNYYFKSRI